MNEPLTALRRANPWIHRGLALTLFMVLGGALSQAAEMTPGVHRALLIAPLIPVAPAPEPAMQPVVVWDGADVDGDGAADFINPTGGEPRGHDAFGNGQFGASRDGGDRHHEGVDYVDTPGQDVIAPISGYVTKIGYAYDNNRDLKFVEITNPAIGYTSRAFYVAPTVQEGQAVQLGEVIGKAESLQGRYAGITNHVHLEVMRQGKRIDCATLISFHTEMRPIQQG
jgi:murein DD-endopeptidase MepM/ murein hydrolase activator NlpD